MFEFHGGLECRTVAAAPSGVSCFNRKSGWNRRADYPKDLAALGRSRELERDVVEMTPDHAAGAVANCVPE